MKLIEGENKMDQFLVLFICSVVFCVASAFMWLKKDDKPIDKNAEKLELLGGKVTSMDHYMDDLAQRIDAVAIDIVELKKAPPVTRVKITSPVPFYQYDLKPKVTTGYNTLSGKPATFKSVNKQLNQLSK